MAGKIFINYRRSVSAKEAKLLHTYLRHHFPARRLFLDTRELDETPNWLQELQRQVDDSSLMLALICEGWAGLRNEQGERRLDSPKDFVRFEISRAITRGMPVIPVRLDGAPMPDARDLPPELYELTKPQASLLRHEGFDDDAEKLVRRIRRELANGQPRGLSRWTAAGVAVAALAVGAYAGQYALSRLNVVAPGIEPMGNAWLVKQMNEARERADQAEAEARRVSLRVAELERALSVAIIQQNTAEQSQEREKARADGLAAELAAARKQVKDAEARLADAQAATAKAEAELDKLRRTSSIPAPTSVAGRSPKPLTSAELAALKPGMEFQECDGCPRMVVVGKGAFDMGSPQDEQDRFEDEDDTPGPGGKQIRVTILRDFAVGKFEVTFDEWDACAADGGCRSNKTPSDQGWGKGKRPVINVSWTDAQEYISWLNGKTGTKPYRLLTEAEWEYAARAGSTTLYSWGDEIGKGNANCDGCGSQWDNKQTAPAGSFKPNRWGLYDVHGNAREWVQDCYAHSYEDAPRDGSAAEGIADCRRVLRGGSWSYYPLGLRSAYRLVSTAGDRYSVYGFRVARTLNP